MAKRDFELACYDISPVEKTRKGFFKSINYGVLAIMILLLTVTCALCFDVLFFKILLIIEIAALGICASYVFHDADDDDTTIEAEFPDGVELISPNVSPKVLYQNIINKNAKEELNELSDYILNPDDYDVGHYIPETRILLCGLPGSGKNALVHAFAHNVGIPLYKINASTILENENVDELLATIFNFSSDFYVLLIESFELFSNQTSETASYILNIVNKIEQQSLYNPNVILFATYEGEENIYSGDATYKMFKKMLETDLPNQDERLELLKEFTSNYSVDDDVDFAAVSKAFIGLTVGDIKYLVKSALSIAHRDKRNFLKQDDFFDALDFSTCSSSTQKHTAEMQKIVAYHEAGHALVQYLVCGKQSVLRIISASRGDVGGYTKPSPEEDKLIFTEEDLLNRICVIYGGRCAEKLIFNHRSTGASVDIENATSLILSMIQSYGMNDEIGPINVAPKLVGMSVVNTSDEIRNVVFKEASKIAKECDKRAFELLSNNREKLDKLANYLIDNESIEGSKLEELLEETAEIENESIEEAKAEELSEETIE